MASRVCERVSGLMSVMAILVQPERAKPFATAAPIPTCYKYFYGMLPGDVPVPPAPVIRATPGSNLASDAMFICV
jgi:hypothetical protein